MNKKLEQLRWMLTQLGLQDSMKKLCHEISQTKKLEIIFEDGIFGILLELFKSLELFRIFKILL